MPYKLLIQEEVITEIQDAFTWYEDQREGLGNELLDEVHESLNHICHQPQHYTALNARFRRIKVARFPYLIIYEVEGNTVIVNSIRHARRRPEA